MRRSAYVTAAALLAVVLSGCGPASEPPVAAPIPTATAEAGPDYAGSFAQPGPFVIRHGDAELRLRPHTACTNGGCVDGVDDGPPSVGTADHLLVSFADAGFENLVATQVSDDDLCVGRMMPASVTDVGDGWWRVEPVGPAGGYRLMLFAHGRAGDAAADVRWQVPDGHPLPPVEASLAVIADHDGRPDSYGVELSVAQLEDAPERASASVTVTAANGASHTIVPELRRDECRAGIGSLFFEASAAEGRKAADLGGFPFDYRVELTIDGVTHVATATFPDDAPEREVAVPLEFSPALR